MDAKTKERLRAQRNRAIGRTCRTLREKGLYSDKLADVVRTSLRFFLQDIIDIVEGAEQ